jgi:HEAT repeat protein
MLDGEEDIYVQLEAAAALAAHNEPSGWAFLRQSLDSDYLTIQLETVIVISEIAQPQSEQLLIAVLADPDRDSEVRAGAAWALGEFKTPDTTAALVDTFNSTGIEIKIEAARALLKIAPAQIATLIEAFKTADPLKRDGIAWALARAGGFDVTKLLNDPQDPNLRQWVSYIAGFGRSLFVEEQVNELCKIDAEVHFAASVLWQLLESWIYGLEEY